MCLLMKSETAVQVYLVPFLVNKLRSNDSCSQGHVSALTVSPSSGGIKLFDIYQPNKSVALGRSDIIASLSAACETGACRSGHIHQASSYEAECSCKKWIRYGARYLNKIMLQFSMDITPVENKPHLFLRPMKNDVLSTIFVNNIMLSRICKSSDTAISLHNYDQLSFVVPCRNETLELSYHLIMIENCQPPISLNTIEDDDKSSILSLCHFSHSFETSQPSSPFHNTRKRPCDSTSSRIPTQNHINIKDNVPLSSLLHVQLKTLRDNYQLTISNQTLSIEAANLENTNRPNDFLDALMNLAVESTACDGTNAGTYDFPELLEKIIVGDDLIYALENNNDKGKLKIL